MSRVGDVEVPLAGDLVVAGLGQVADLADVSGAQLQRRQQRRQLVVRHVAAREESKQTTHVSKHSNYCTHNADWKCTM